MTFEEKVDFVRNLKGAPASVLWILRLPPMKLNRPSPLQLATENLPNVLQETAESPTKPNRPSSIPRPTDTLTNMLQETAASPNKSPDGITSYQVN
jgi:hypothetical protein